MSELIAWIDIEMSGTSPETDKLLEIASCITDMSGEKISDYFHRLSKIDNLSEIIESAEDEIKKMHEKSGLWEDLWSSHTYDIEDIDYSLSRWIREYSTNIDFLYLGGNTVTLDRMFMKLHLPRTYNLLSYRSIDVTSISLTVQKNSFIPGFEKSKKHRATSDVENSIKEYVYYLKNLNLNRS